MKVIIRLNFMIITRSPLRISIFGGGTDLEYFYSNHGSKFISLAIDKYVYSIIHEPFEEKYILKYIKNEIVNDIKFIKNELLKKILLEADIKTPIEISTLADIPYGSGLGSSGAYISSLLHSLSKEKSFKSEKNKFELARKASKIETSHFDNKIVGLQDTYASIFGGLKIYTVSKAGNVKVDNLMNVKRVDKFAGRLSLFYTNKTRKTTMQNSKLSTGNQEKNLLEVKKIALKGSKALIDGDHKTIGHLLHKQWKLKYERQPSSFHKKINNVIEESVSAGALGGKLIGAGGGGFILLYLDGHQNKKIEKIMKENNYKNIKFNADHVGTNSFTV